MKYYKYIVIFLSILILLLGGYIIYVQSTITPLDNNDIKEENNKDSINNINKELDYDCSFTQTFRFYQKIDYHPCKTNNISLYINTFKNQIITLNYLFYSISI